MTVQKEVHGMRRCVLVAVICVLVPAAAARCLDCKAYQARDDFNTATLQECNLQYYYYIPCPTYSWFWGFFNWAPGDKIGTFFTIGDVSTAGFSQCDSANCHDVVGLRVLDFAGYGQLYPGYYTVKFNIYCCDETGCPIGNSLWESPPIETVQNWNFVPIDSVPITGCCIEMVPPVRPRILVTATHIGSDCTYPQWGMDNISTPALAVCAMHDAGCLPSLYPRPTSSHYSTIHSGYYGVDFQYCPPIWFVDGVDTSADAHVYGYLEFAWRLFLACGGPHATQSTTWGTIKSMYR
jgi:hypothetical protein